jgi:predicted XRE-type DNA-binding protein
MCNEIAVIADGRDMTQAQVAEIAGIAQSDVSRIVNGNVKDYSVWRLMRVLNRLGKDVTVEFSNTTEECGQVFTRFVEPEPDEGHAPTP